MTYNNKDRTTTTREAVRGSLTLSSYFRLRVYYFNITRNQGKMLQVRKVNVLQICSKLGDITRFLVELNYSFTVNFFWEPEWAAKNCFWDFDNFTEVEWVSKTESLSASKDLFIVIKSNGSKISLSILFRVKNKQTGNMLHTAF